MRLCVNADSEDPPGYILRQGWATLDFSDGDNDAPHPGLLPIRCGEGALRRLHETLQLEIIAVLESLNRLRESPDYELCQLSERKPGLLDELKAVTLRAVIARLELLLENPIAPEAFPTLLPEASGKFRLTCLAN
jgi:hypothetical protein